MVIMVMPLLGVKTRCADKPTAEHYEHTYIHTYIGVVGINTPWHFRYLQQVQMPIYTVSSPRPLEIGMNSLIL